MRPLQLRKETLTELGTDDLAVIVGADPKDPPQPTPPVYTPTLPLERCLPTG